MVFSNLSERKIKIQKKLSFILSFNKFLFNILAFIPLKALNVFRWALLGVFWHLYNNATFYKRFFKIIILIGSISFNLFNLCYWQYEKFFGNNSWNPLNKYILINILVIVCYILLVKLCDVFYYFKGKYIVFQEEQRLSEEYIINKLPHILKVFGKTRVGKDTFVAGATSVIVRSFRRRTDEDLANIVKICYILDFDLIDRKLSEYRDFFKSSYKGKIKNNFFWMAKDYNGFIKKYYRKVLNYDYLLYDYEEFSKAPVEYDTKYCFGVGVQRKHFYDLVIEYILLWVRKYVEDRYTVFNQPFYEDIRTFKKAKMFSLNFTATKTIEKLITNPSTHKKENLKANVFFPWKDRLVIGETECGTWYSNIDSFISSYIKEMGCRDFKAFQGHLMQDLYWFQVDQESDRINKSIRALDHGYLGIVAREEIKGGALPVFFLNIFIRFLEWNIGRIENSLAKKDMYNMRLKEKMEYYNKLYCASSKDKYRIISDKLLAKINKKKTFKTLEPSKKAINKLSMKIALLEKTGFIKQIIVMSETGTMPADLTPVPLRSILRDEKLRLTNTHITTVVHNTCDCEVYDTRYMKNLGEERAKESKINFADLREWDSNFKMTSADIMYMAYPTAQNMFDIDKDEYNDILFRDGIKKYMKNN